MRPRGIRIDRGRRDKGVDPDLIARVRVSAPASTSNLGPGFDCLGLALGLRNEATLEHRWDEGPDEVHIEGEGADSLPRDASNVVLRAARAAAGDLSRGRLRLRCKNRIPLARGLGSSAAAIVSGLWAGAELAAFPPSDDELAALAVSMEGHPDNVAPCIRGGFTASVALAEGPATYALELHKRFSAVVVIPEFQLETKKSRAALPKEVPLADAVFNVSHALMLVRALEKGWTSEIARLMADRLHQPYRAPLVPGLPEALAAAVKAGAAGAALSGSGPTVFAFAAAKTGKRAGEAMRRAFAQKGVAARALALPIERRGVVVEEFVHRVRGGKPRAGRS